MKEVKKCSISGIAFTLDADAYALLSRYLDSLKATYAETADGDEIVADIEARIAELILSQQENSRVVETPLLRQIISQMGTAEDISSESETDAAKKQPRIPRRLYRDTENARLGGVCAGLGRYFDVDATWVRLTLFAPLLLLILVEVLPFSGTLSTFFSNLFGVFVLGYFIMWFAVPAARSARQKLEMEGEPITVRSIREKTVRDSETNSDVKSIVARVIYALGQLALIVIKIFIGFFIFGLTFAACILLIVLFALIFGDPGGSGTLSIAGWTMTTTAMGVMGLLTVSHPAAAAHLHPLLPDRLAQTQRARHADRLPALDPDDRRYRRTDPAGVRRRTAAPPARTLRRGARRTPRQGNRPYAGVGGRRHRIRHCDRTRPADRSGKRFRTPDHDQGTQETEGRHPRDGTQRRHRFRRRELRMTTAGTTRRRETGGRTGRLPVSA